MEMINKLVDVINPDGSPGKHWVNSEASPEPVQAALFTAHEPEEHPVDEKEEHPDVEVEHE